MSDYLSLLAAGDVHIGSPGSYPEFLPHGSEVEKDWTDPYNWLSDISPILNEGDFTIANLEGPICENNPSTDANGSAGTGPIGLKMPPSAADALDRAGFNAVGLANNISMNLGPNAIVETMERLEQVDIEWAGAGRDIESAREPAILEKNGVRIALLAFTSIFRPGLFPAGPSKPGLVTVPVATQYQPPENYFYNPGLPPRLITKPDQDSVSDMREDVKNAADQADVVIVGWHWGFTQYAYSHAMGVPIEKSPFYVLDYQEEMAKEAIDAGADMILGTHPHQLQGMEWYNEKLICYSLGNLAFSFAEVGNFGPESVIVDASIDPDEKTIEDISLVPVQIPHETMEPKPATRDEAEHTSELLEQLSESYGTSFELENNEIMIT